MKFATLAIISTVAAQVIAEPTAAAVVPATVEPVEPVEPVNVEPVGPGPIAPQSTLPFPL